MLSRLNERMRTILLGGAAALLAAVLYTFAWTPLYDDYRSTLTRMEMLLSRMEQVERQLQQMELLDRAYRDHLARMEDLERRMFTGDRPSLVGAEIQQLLSEVCQKQGVSIRRSRMLKEGTAGNYRQIQVKIELDASLEALSHILHELFENRYLFMVPEFKVASVGRGTQLIRVDMTVAGLMRGA